MYKKVLSVLLAIVIICGAFCLLEEGLISAKNNQLNTVENFKVSSQTSDCVKLSWNKVSGARGYLLYSYSFKNNKWVRISKLHSASKRISGLNEGTKYLFALRSYTVINKRVILSKNLSKVVTVTPLKSVKGFQANARWHCVSLSWNKSSSAQRYILYKKAGNKWEVLEKFGADTTKYTANNLNSNTKYTFGIKAYKKAGSQMLSSEKISVVNTKTLSPAIKNLRSIFAENKVRLNWNKLNKAKVYNIYSYDFSSSKWSFVSQTTAIAFSVPDLKTSTVYRFGIVPVTDGKALDIDNMAVTEGKTIPGAFKYNVALENGLLKFNWQAQKNVADYIVFTKLPGENWQRVALTSNTSCEITAPKAEKFYVAVKGITYYKGKAVGGLFIKKLVQTKPYDYALYCDGDSIAAGTGSNGYSYAAIFAENHNMSLTNFAVGGATLSSGVNGRYHIAQSVIDHLDNSYDYIFFDGGANDFSVSAKLGKMTADNDTDFDMNTTCGAFEAMLTFAKKTCPTAKIYYISVHRIYDESRKNLSDLTYNDYRVALEDICKKYNVPVVDCYHTDFDFAYTFAKNGVYPKGDTIHPTEQGYRMFYMPVLEEVVNFKG